MVINVSMKFNMENYVIGFNSIFNLVHGEDDQLFKMVRLNFSGLISFCKCR